MKAVAGITAIAWSVPAVTVTLVDPATEPKLDGLVAVTVTVPADEPLTIPPMSTEAAPETS